MAVIKHAQSERMVKDAIVLDLGDLQRQGQRILEAARAEAAKIIAAGRAEAARATDSADARGHEIGHERGLQEGRERGRTEGRDEALEEIRPRLSQIAAGWEAALVRWDADRAAMLVAARREVLVLALAVAERVIHRAISADASVIADQLDHALELVTRPTEVAVTIHPDDRPALELALPGILDRRPPCRHAAIREDPTVARGGCVVTTRGGRIDATIDTQVRRIVEALVPPPEGTPPDAAPGDSAA
jgi:flagellar biosynthesis/type III secretory pathway protein FliH